MNLAKYLVGINPHAKIKSKGKGKIDKDDIAWRGAIFLMTCGGLLLFCSLVSFLTLDFQSNIEYRIRSWQKMGLDHKEVVLLALNSHMKLDRGGHNPTWFVLRSQGGWILLAGVLCFLSVPIKRHIQLSFHKARCDIWDVPHGCEKPKEHRMYHVAYNECPCGYWRTENT